MQQIKIKSFRKKKNLTIESIKVQIFEKNHEFVHKRYNTVDQTDKDIIFTHSKRYLQSIVPKKHEEKQQKYIRQTVDEQNARQWIKRYSIKQPNESECIKRGIYCVKELNQLKLSIKRNPFENQVEQFQKLNKKIYSRQPKYIKSIRNDIQIAKCFSQKVQRIKTDSKLSFSDGQELNFPKTGYQNSLLLKPLNISVDLPRSLRKNMNGHRIKKLENDLLQENRSSKSSQVSHKGRQTQISPWRLHQSQSQDQFSPF